MRGGVGAGRDTGVTAIWVEGVAGHTGQTNKSLYNLGFSPIVKACWAEPSSRPRSQPEHGIYISTVLPSPALCQPEESCLSLSGGSHHTAHPASSAFALHPAQGSRSGLQSVTLVNAPIWTPWRPGAANGQAPQTNVDESGAEDPLGIASAKMECPQVGDKLQPQDINEPSRHGCKTESLG